VALVIIATCPDCDAVHWVEEDEPPYTLMRAGTVAIEDCPRCTIIENLARA